MSERKERYGLQYFSINIGSLLLLIDGSGNGVLGGMLGGIFDSAREGHVGGMRRGNSTDGRIICHHAERNDVSRRGAFHKVMSCCGSRKKDSNSGARISHEIDTKHRKSSGTLSPVR